MGFIIGAIKIIFLLGFLVLIHEAGHFFMARKCRVKVREFSIGFGKELWSKQGKETKYTIRMIPLGGFVNMLGEEERADEEGSFNKASVGKRILIVAAGAIVNIVFGILVFFILASIVNKSVVDGLIVTKNYLINISQSLIMLVTGKAGSAGEVVGPVGISQMIVGTNTIIDFVYLLSMISISLGITNLLPIPALDGGKILILIIELIRKKQMEEKTELTITSMRIIVTINYCSYSYSKRYYKNNIRGIIWKKIKKNY